MQERSTGPPKDASSGSDSGVALGTTGRGGNAAQPPTGRSSLAPPQLGRQQPPAAAQAGPGAAQALQTADSSDAPAGARAAAAGKLLGEGALAQLSREERLARLQASLTAIETRYRERSRKQRSYLWHEPQPAPAAVAPWSASPQGWQAPAAGAGSWQEAGDFEAQQHHQAQPQPQPLVVQLPAGETLAEAAACMDALRAVEVALAAEAERAAAAGRRRTSSSGGSSSMADVVGMLAGDPCEALGKLQDLEDAGGQGCARVHVRAVAAEQFPRLPHPPARPPSTPAGLPVAPTSKPAADIVPASPAAGDAALLWVTAYQPQGPGGICHLFARPVEAVVLGAAGDQGAGAARDSDGGDGTGPCSSSTCADHEGAAATATARWPFGSFEGLTFGTTADGAAGAWHAWLLLRRGAFATDATHTLFPNAVVHVRGGRIAHNMRDGADLATFVADAQLDAVALHAVHLARCATLNREVPLPVEWCMQQLQARWGLGALVRLGITKRFVLELGM
jgi:hypothetical protein